MSAASKKKKLDIFDVVFDVLSDSLTTNHDPGVAASIDEKLSTIVWKEIKHKANVHANELKQIRQSVVCLI